MSVKKVIPGEVLYFCPEDLTVIVVMVGEDGFRYYNPLIPEFDTKGSIVTRYITYDALSKWTISLGSITNISATLMGKKS